MEKPKRKSRDGHARKATKEAPAEIEPPAPGENLSEPPPFSAKAVAERLNLWWHKGKDVYLRPSPSGEEWLPEPGKGIARLLRINGVHTRGGAGRTHSQADEVMQYVHDFRHVSFAGPLAGKKAGVFMLDGGRPVIVTNSFDFVEPAPGECPLHRKLLETVLRTDEIDQTLWVYAWLKTSRATLKAGTARPAPWLVFAGPSNCGKSFIQHSVLSPMLGGSSRHNDPRDWMFDRTQHNADLIGAEHLILGELPAGLDHESRSNLAEKMKQIVVNRWHRVRAMNQDGFFLPVFWRASLSMNDSVERLKRLPPLSSDFADKVILLACESRQLPMPTDTDDDWLEFERALAMERAAFAHFIDNEFEIPESMRRTKDAARYGFDGFHHPRLVASLFEQETESSLLYMIDGDLFTGEGTRQCDGNTFKDSWGWSPSEKLAEILRESGRFGNQARVLLKYPNACGLYLKKLSDKFPKRFESKHTNRGNLWLIRPPE